jgi:hypothetical protein
MPIDVDKKRALTYQILADILLKIICALAAIVAFFIVLFSLIKQANSYTTITLGAIDAILAGTLYPMFRYFFPKRDKEAMDKAAAAGSDES